MAKKRPKKPSGPLDPAAVLDGRVQATPMELIDLINRINPTDRDLPGPDETRRYSIKNRLQSMLIRLYPDEVRVIREPGKEGLVLLQHRGTGRSAGHAVVINLDEGARLWVRRRVDEELAEASAKKAQNHATKPQRTAKRDNRRLPPEPPVPPLEGKSPDELLAQGREALGAYDFVLARQSYQRALELDPYNSDLLLALLELLVDHLASYQEVLDLSLRLPPSLEAHGQVRAYLALAAARAGRTSRARELLKEAEGPLVAQVHLALANQALKGEREDEGAYHLAEAGRLGVEEPDLRGLGEALAALKARRRQPLEEQAGEAFERGDLADAEALARDVLARWPDSVAARIILGKVDRRRREDRANHLMAEGERALSADDFATALACFREAQALGAEGLEEYLALALEGRQREEASLRVARVREMLSHPDRLAGLVAYGELDPDLRLRLRAELGGALLAWMEETGALQSRSKARVAAEAALALEAALVSLDAGAPERALELLAPHDRLLRGVGWAQRARARAEALLARTRHGQALSALAEAGHAVEGGDWERAASLLESLNDRLLAEDQRAWAAELKGSIQRQQELDLLRRRAERVMEEGDWLEARRRVEGLLERLPPGERGEWERRGQEVAQAISRQWRLRTYREGNFALEGLQEWFVESKRLWLGPDGVLYLVNIFDVWAFVRAVDPTTGQVLWATSLQLPQHISFPFVMVDGPHLSIVTEEELVVFQMNIETQQVLRWEELKGLIPLRKHEGLDSLAFIPRTSLLLVSLEKAGVLSYRFLLLDLAALRVKREFPQEVTIPFRDIVVLGGEQPFLLIRSSAIEERWRSFSLQGNASSLPVPPEFIVSDTITGAAIHPDGASLLIKAEKEENWVLIRRLDPHGQEGDPFVLQGFDWDRRNYMLTALDQGLTFLLYDSGEEEFLLVALRPQGDSLELVYRVPVPPSCVLAQDGASRQVILLAPCEEGLEVVPLSLTPPALGSGLQSRRPLFAAAHQPLAACAEPLKELNPSAQALADQIGRVDRKEMAAWVREQIRLAGDDPEMLMDLYSALERCHCSAEILHDLACCSTRSPLSPLMAYRRAKVMALRERWDDVRKLLKPLLTYPFEGRERAHLRHLLGLALYQKGKNREAISVWREGLALGDHGCPLEPLIDLAHPLPPRVLSDGWWQGLSLIAQIRGSIHNADLHLKGGELRWALEAIDRPWVWHGRELQSLGRLADILLALTPERDSARFHKALALAYFCDTQGTRESVQNIPLGSLTWGRERLEGLAARCRRWLEEEMEGEIQAP